LSRRSESEGGTPNVQRPMLKSDRSGVEGPNQRPAGRDQKPDISRRLLDARQGVY
jgi:hypothetical protein